MTVIEAVETIIQLERSARITKTGYIRLLKAGKTLGLSDVEQVRLDKNLDYRDGKGELHFVIRSK